MHEFHEYQGRRWPVVLSYLVIAFIFSVAVVFLGRTIYRSIDHSSAEHGAPAQTQHIAKNHPAKQKGKSKIANPSAGQVPNTGPGNVAAVFAVSSLMAGGAHYTLRRRRGV